jgi:hypothetical protein
VDGLELLSTVLESSQQLSCPPLEIRIGNLIVSSILILLESGISVGYRSGISNPYGIQGSTYAKLSPNPMAMVGM